MHLTRLAGLYDDVGLGAGLLTDQVMVYSGRGK